MSDNTDQPFDGKTLWHVTLEVEVVVLAKTRQDAEALGRDEWRDISGDCDPDVSASPCEIPISGKKRWSIPGSWDRSEPYGDDEGMTCGQIIEAIEEYRNRPMPPTAAELEAAGQGVLQGCK